MTDPERKGTTVGRRTLNPVAGRAALPGFTNAPAAAARGCTTLVMSHQGFDSPRWLRYNVDVFTAEAAHANRQPA